MSTTKYYNSYTELINDTPEAGTTGIVEPQSLSMVYDGTSWSNASTTSSSVTSQEIKDLVASNDTKLDTIIELLENGSTAPSDPPSFEVTGVSIENNAAGDATLHVTASSGSITSDTDYNFNFQIAGNCPTIYGAEYHPSSEEVVISSGQWIESDITFSALPEVNITSDKLLTGCSAINSNGEVVNGRIDTVVATKEGSTVTVPVGYIAEQQVITVESSGGSSSTTDSDLICIESYTPASKAGTIITSVEVSGFSSGCLDEEYPEDTAYDYEDWNGTYIPVDSSNRDPNKMAFKHTTSADKYLYKIEDYDGSSYWAFYSSYDKSANTEYVDYYKDELSSGTWSCMYSESRPSEFELTINCVETTFTECGPVIVGRKVTDYDETTRTYTLGDTVNPDETENDLIVGGIYHMHDSVVIGRAIVLNDTFPSPNALFAINAVEGSADLVSGQIPTFIGTGKCLRDNTFCIDTVCGYVYQSNDSLHNLNDFTVELDFTITDDPIRDNVSCLFVSGSDSASDFKLMWSPSGNEFTIFYSNDYVTKRAEYVTFGKDTVEVGDNIYHHMIIYRTGKKLFAQIDNHCTLIYDNAYATISFEDTLGLGIRYDGSESEEVTAFPGRITHLQILPYAKVPSDLYTPPTWCYGSKNYDWKTRFPKYTYLDPLNGNDMYALSFCRTNNDVTAWSSSTTDRIVDGGLLITEDSGTELISSSRVGIDDINGDFTISFNVFIDEVVNSSGVVSLISDRYNHWIRLEYNFNTKRFVFKLGDGSTFVDSEEISGHRLNLSTITTITLLKESGTFKFYLDGLLIYEKTTSITFTNQANSEYLMICTNSAAENNLNDMNCKLFNLVYCTHALSYNIIEYHLAQHEGLPIASAQSVYVASGFPDYNGYYRFRGVYVNGRPYYSGDSREIRFNGKQWVMQSMLLNIVDTQIYQINYEETTNILEATWGTYNSETDEYTPVSGTITVQ